METKIYESSDKEGVALCGKIIASGGIVAFPTETVYGLGCSAYDGEAAKKVFDAKGRPGDNPLIVHIADKADIERIAFQTQLSKKLADAFMPGPFTMILPKKDVIPSEVTAGLDTVAIRFPESREALELIKAAGVPIAAPSANISGRPSPTRASHVIEDLSGRVDAIISGADCKVGLESTVVAVKEQGVLLCRPGKITPEDIEALGIKVEIPENLNRTAGDGERVISPGMKYKHYAPKGKLILLEGDGTLERLVKEKENGCGIICFDEDMELLAGVLTVSLGRKEDSESHAERLFAALRFFDSENTETIYSRVPKKSGVGLAVYNRILKAAGSRVEKL